MERLIEIFNSVLAKSNAGQELGRILYVYPPDFILARTSLDAASEQATSMVIAADSVLYADSSIRSIAKPVALLVEGDKITRTLVGKEFDQWIAK